jgi:hypothetical protein
MLLGAFFQASLIKGSPEKGGFEGWDTWRSEMMNLLT